MYILYVYIKYVVYIYKIFELLFIIMCFVCLVHQKTDFDLGTNTVTMMRSKTRVTRMSQLFVVCIDNGKEHCYYTVHTITLASVS